MGWHDIELNDGRNAIQKTDSTIAVMQEIGNKTWHVVSLSTGVPVYVDKNNSYLTLVEAMIAVEKALPTVQESDINHPSRYGGDNTYECIKVIDALGHGESFCIGSALKYIFRFRKKGTPKQDLQKAIWYLQHIVDRIED